MVDILSDAQLSSELAKSAMKNFYEIQTAHGSKIVVDLKTGVLQHGQPSNEGFALVVLWIPPNYPNACLLLSSRTLANSLSLDRDFGGTDVISLVLAETAGGLVTLQHPLSKNYLCAVISQSPIGELLTNRTEVKDWEQFLLLPLEAVPNDVISQVGRYACYVDSIRYVQTAVAAIKANALSEDPVDLSPLLRLAGPSEFDWLGRAMSRDYVLSKAFAMTSKDLWARDAIPGLFQTQTEDRTRAIDTSLDILAAAGLTTGYCSVGQIYNAFARRDRMPTKGLCLVASARNEGLYLLEWIAHHRALGVEEFFLYTNNNDDGSDALLAALAAAGVITWINNTVKSGGAPQYKAYGHAFQILPDLLQYRWVGVIDLDEFIVVDKTRHSSIPAFISARETEPCDAIALSWVMFGPNGHTHRTADPLTRRFRTRELAVNPHVKSLCRPAKFIHSQCHYPIWDNYELVTFRNALGGLHPKSTVGDQSAFSPMPTDQDAWIAHFFTKSAEEFILRRSFGPGDSRFTVEGSGDFFHAGLVDLFVSLFKSQSNKVDDRALACNPDLERDIEELRRLPNVNSAMLGVEQTYRTRLQALSDVLSTDPRFLVENSNERWFAEIVANSAASGSARLPLVV